MINEDYVSFEVAKLLKEKGFDEPCRTFYKEKELINDVCTQYYQWNTKSTFGLISAPTHQMAMKWLREEHEISIEISALKRNHWVYTIYKILDSKVKELYNDGEFKSHKEAVEEALEYCLENLI